MDGIFRGSRRLGMGSFHFGLDQKNPRGFEIPRMGIGDLGFPKISSEKSPKIANPGDGDLRFLKLKIPNPGDGDLGF